MTAVRALIAPGLRFGSGAACSPVRGNAPTPWAVGTFALIVVSAFMARRSISDPTEITYYVC
ncbi:hypothetical protein [Nocardia sp. NPDC059239]|uniref:hypothetical protein n=1 Tax=unclassified Nocardia TaxID=2637762 RepID=UPI0036C57AF0